MKHILVCEDEAAIREFVVFNLQRAGYTVLAADSGEKALELYETAAAPIDVALLDVMLPGIDGFTVCEQLRKQDASIGIVMLTARSQESEKITGLQKGADDYVTKPFSPAELVARVEALYRRVQVANEKKDTLSRGEFVLDMRSHLLRVKDTPVELTQTEFQLLEFLFSHPDVCHKREAIIQHVWGDAYVGDPKVVDVNLRRLRMKIEKDPSAPRHLITEWGKGYMWKD
ncbi:MAG: response regulator transcription factor [Clostridia bacterium]|nr:response regulator transcription factor [Clostridia bacterium]